VDADDKPWLSCHVLSPKSECGHLNGGKSKAVTYAFPPGYRENAEEEEEEDVTSSVLRKGTERIIMQEIKFLWKELAAHTINMKQLRLKEMGTKDPPSPCFQYNTRPFRPLSNLLLNMYINNLWTCKEMKLVYSFVNKNR
jgi:hypothetical protein